MGKGNMLTLQEKKLIQQGIAQGLSASKIAVTLGRAKNSVVFEIRRAGGRENYDAEKAHELQKKRIKEGYIAISKNNKRLFKENKMSIPYLNLNKKIENLEFQIEILIDLLKQKDKT